MPDLEESEMGEHVQGLCCWQSCEGGSSGRKEGKTDRDIGECSFQPPLVYLREMLTVDFSEVATGWLQLSLGSAPLLPGRRKRNNSTFNQFFKEMALSTMGRVWIPDPIFRQMDCMSWRSVKGLCPTSISRSCTRNLHECSESTRSKILDPLSLGWVLFASSIIKLARGRSSSSVPHPLLLPQNYRIRKNIHLDSVENHSTPFHKAAEYSGVTQM